MDIVEAINISNKCSTLGECEDCPLGKAIEFSIGDSVGFGYKIITSTCGIVGLLNIAIKQLNGK